MAKQQIINPGPLLCIAFKYALATGMYCFATYCRGQLDFNGMYSFSRDLFLNLECANY